MNKKLRQKVKDESGLGTLEIVLIIAVLIAVALIFRQQLTSFANSLIQKVFDHSVIDSVGY
ncbi:MAG: hypothetical protein GX326_02330 [Clostridiaceae bacterium]|nr:hypothetical protein [Clostridiaceae bacterium]